MILINSNTYKLVNCYWLVCKVKMSVDLKKVFSHCYCSEFSNFSSFQSFLTNFPSIWLFLAKKCTKMAFFDAVWRTAAKNQNKMSQAKMLKIHSYLVSWGIVYGFQYSKNMAKLPIKKGILLIGNFQKSSSKDWTKFQYFSLEFAFWLKLTDCRAPHISHQKN